MNSAPLFFHDSRLDGLEFSGLSIYRMFLQWVGLGIYVLRKRLYNSRVYLLLPDKQSVYSKYTSMCFSTWLSTGLYPFLKLAWSSWVSGLTGSCFYGIYFMGTSQNAFLQQSLLVQSLRLLLLLYLYSLRLLDKRLCSQHSYSAFVH